ncbi:MAG: ABC transporter permease [Acidobacteria bacterium]|nr:ABC transporter permease [Acidobacteriota bacterium]
MTGRQSCCPPHSGSDRIPWLVGFVLHLLLPASEREFFLGDLKESRRLSWVREILGALALRLSAHSYPRNNPACKGDSMLREILFDLKFGLRLMRRSPGFTIVALATMALGIGANTAMFSIVNGVLLKPLPYPEAARIVRLMESNLSRGWGTFSIAPLNFWDWQERNRSLELIGAYYSNSVNWTGGDRPESISAYQVSEDFLKILGGEPARGRGIVKADLNPDGVAVVILSHGFWQRAFGGNPDVLGRTMILDGVIHTVVGILPEEWRSIQRNTPDIVLPLRPQPYWYTARGNHFLHAVGRLKRGVTVEQARSDLSAIASALEAEYPDSNTGWGAVVRPIEDVIIGTAGTQLLTFMATVGLVLLIACANLAHITLARATVRARELAVRTAVGAGRRRVLRQLLVESLLLAALGGVLGVALADTALEAFVAGWPTLLPRMQEIGINFTVLLFCLGLSAFSGLLFGLFPALSVVRPNIMESLRQGGRSLAGDGSRRWMRSGLVVTEVGLAAVLLVGTGLLLRSFSALRAENPGFLTEDRLILSTPLSRAKYSEPQSRQAYADAALARIRALPGVESAALSSLIPLQGYDQIWGFWIEGRASLDSQEDGNALFYRVSPGYFETMGIPIVAGRDITPADREDAPPVALIGESLATRHFPGENPLGKRIRFGRDEDDPPVGIVGVVGDVQHYSLGDSSMAQVYVPFAQRLTGDISFVVKSAVPPLSLVPGIRKSIGAIDPDQPLVEIQPATALVSESISMPRFRTLLMTGFGLTALLLAMVGLYGVMANNVSQRTREFGVRMALGATRASVLRLVFRQGVPLVGIGLALGLAGALALSRTLESMLFGVKPGDPAVFAAVPVLLAAVALAAMLIPARRATRLDPVRTLGDE